jgi:hypothetical protein
MYILKLLYLSQFFDNNVYIETALPFPVFDNNVYIDGRHALTLSTPPFNHHFHGRGQNLTL